MTNKALEFLVTAQGYEKQDPYKQTILLHDTFDAADQQQAKEMFNTKFAGTHKIMKIYSAVDVTENKI